MEEIVSERFYRPALDVVRFCAFFLVFLHHVLPPDGRTPALSAVGASCGLGLCLFFSLSSYLITLLLLLREQDATDTVNLRSFYQRRMLRIWPLYFATLLAGIMLAALMRHSLHHSYKTWFIAALLTGGIWSIPPFP